MKQKILRILASGVIVVIGLLGLVGCGQSGMLYMPGDKPPASSASVSI